jgi:hypothetical protein
MLERWGVAPNIFSVQQGLFYASLAHTKARAYFHLFKRRGRKISGGVQAASLSGLRQGLGIGVKAFHTK